MQSDLTGIEAASNSFSELNTNTSTAQIQPKTKIPQTLAEIYTPEHFYLSHLHIVHRNTSTRDKLGMQNELPLHAKTWPKALSYSLSLSHSSYRSLSHSIHLFQLSRRYQLEETDVSSCFTSWLNFLAL